jgi:hypothetical protein
MAAVSALAHVDAEQNGSGFLREEAMLARLTPSPQIRFLLEDA